MSLQGGLCQGVSLSAGVCLGWVGLCPGEYLPKGVCVCVGGDGGIIVQGRLSKVCLSTEVSVWRENPL